MNYLYLLYVCPVSLSYCRLGFCTCFNFCNFNFKYSEFVTFYICKETDCVYCHPSLMPVFCFCNVKYREQLHYGFLVYTVDVLNFVLYRVWDSNSIVEFDKTKTTLDS